MAKANTTGPKVSVTALVPIEHDGDSYNIGDSIDLSKGQADALIERGAAQIAPVADETKPAGK